MMIVALHVNAVSSMVTVLVQKKLIMCNSIAMIAPGPRLQPASRRESPYQVVSTRYWRYLHQKEIDDKV